MLVVTNQALPRVPSPLVLVNVCVCVCIYKAFLVWWFYMRDGSNIAYIYICIHMAWQTSLINCHFPTKPKCGLVLVNTTDSPEQLMRAPIKWSLPFILAFKLLNHVSNSFCLDLWLTKQLSYYNIVSHEGTEVKWTFQKTGVSSPLEKPNGLFRRQECPVLLNVLFFTI